MQNKHLRNPDLTKMIKDLRDMENGDKIVNEPLKQMKRNLKRMEAGTEISNKEIIEKLNELICTF